MAYLDDIITFSPTLEEHTKHIQKVFDHLRQHDVKLKPPKCEFIQDQTQYVGITVSKDGIIQTKQIQAIFSNKPSSICITVKYTMSRQSDCCGCFYCHCAVASPRLSPTPSADCSEWTNIYTDRSF